jgi:hypothetical protein
MMHPIVTHRYLRVEIEERNDWHVQPHNGHDLHGRPIVDGIPGAIVTRVRALPKRITVTKSDSVEVWVEEAGVASHMLSQNYVESGL